MMSRWRKTKVVATLGPSSGDAATIAALAAAGVDGFRLDFNQGSYAEQQERLRLIRRAEVELRRPLGVIADLQGPQARLGLFDKGAAVLGAGAVFRLDLDPRPGDAQRVCLPHAELFDGLHADDHLLIDDGVVRLRVLSCGADHAVTEVVAGGLLADRQRIAVAGNAAPASSLTGRSRNDLAFALAMNVDWVSLSFIGRAEDITELRSLVRGRAGVIAKLDKPLAVEQMLGAIEAADAVMLMRAELGAGVPPEDMPLLQRRLVRSCRALNKPVVIASQLLESMGAALQPTRAEAADVAAAVCDGPDALMLAAESAVGRHPLQAARMMDRIVRRTEADPYCRSLMMAGLEAASEVARDGLGAGLRALTDAMEPAGTVVYSVSGTSVQRMAGERPSRPLIGLTPQEGTARRLSLVWGVVPVRCREAHQPDDVIRHALDAAAMAHLPCDRLPLVVLAGIPFGTPGMPSLLRVVAAGDPLTPSTDRPNARSDVPAARPAE